MWQRGSVGVWQCVLMYCVAVCEVCVCGGVCGGGACCVCNSQIQQKRHMPGVRQAQVWQQEVWLCKLCS